MSPDHDDLALGHDEAAAAERRRERRREAAKRTSRQRRLAALAFLVLLVAVPFVVITSASGGGSGGSGGSAGGESADGGEPAEPPPPPELPRGGRRLFPDWRLVAFYGAPQADALGILGIGTPEEAAAKLVRQARPYERPNRPVLPMFELLATIVNPVPGDDGKYRTRQRDAVIARYLRAARKAKALLLLDIQPGYATFPDEARALERWLKEPDVGLALDPEWRMTDGGIPGQVIGSVEAAEVNRTSAYLAEIVRRYRLPEKLFLVHQFTTDMIRDKARVAKRPGLATVMNVDGFGTPAQKIDKWRAFTRERVKFLNGYKLFYEEDTDLMSPRDVLRMRPPPDVIAYE